MFSSCLISSYSGFLTRPVSPIFSWSTLNLMLYYLFCSIQKNVLGKAFPSRFTCKNTFIKLSFCDIRTSFISFVAHLNRFEKEAVPNEHLVSAAQENDSFYRVYSSSCLISSYSGFLTRPVSHIFSWSTLNLISYYLFCSIQKNVLGKAFPSRFTCKNTFIKLSFCDIRTSFISFVAHLNRFEKEAVPNEHLVSAAQENDPFYRSKNRTFMPSFFS